MKTRSILFSILSIPVICLCQTSFNKTDMQTDGLLGNVKQVKQNSYLAQEKFGELIQGSKKDNDTYLKLYNEKGNLTEWFIYIKDPDKYQKHTFKYLDSLSKKEENLYRVDGGLDWKYIYKYDKENQIEESWYAADGRLCRKGIYKYDDKDNRVEAKFYNADGNLECKYTYLYDSKKNVSEENMYNASDDLNWKRLYKYDDKGNVTETSEYKNNGRLKWNAIYKYDDKHNVIEKNEYKADGSLEIRKEYLYEYDKTGNWIKKTNKIGKERSFIIREISYY